MSFEEDEGRIFLLNSPESVLVVRLALRNHLLCYESPTTMANMASSFLPLPSPAQLQILPPCLTHQFFSSASYFSFFSLLPNSQFHHLFGKLIILARHHSDENF